MTQAAGGAFMDPSYFTVGGHGGPNTLDNIFTITGASPAIVPVTSW